MTHNDSQYMSSSSHLATVHDGAASHTLVYMNMWSPRGETHSISACLRFHEIVITLSDALYERPPSKCSGKLNRRHFRVGTRRNICFEVVCNRGQYINETRATRAYAVYTLFDNPLQSAFKLMNTYLAAPNE